MNPSSRRLALAAWALVGLAIGIAAPPNPLGLTNDGAQYLSGARNLRAGQGYATSILYFDEHYRSGRVPSPQTVWPPAYSAALAGLGAAGLTEDTSVRVLGVISLGAILGLAFLLGVTLSGSLLGGSLAALWAGASTELLFYVRTPSTELAFIALVLGALAAAAGAEAGRAGRWIAAGLLAAAATYVRYAGLFVAAGLGLYGLLTAWRSGGAWRDRLRPVLGLVPGGVLIGALLVRNLILAGTVSGGNSKTVSQPVAGLLRETVIAIVDGLAGASLSDLRAGGFRAVLAAAGFAALVLAAGLVLRAGRELRRPGFVLVLLVAGAYAAGVIAVSSRTMLTFGLRYLLPVLPCLAALIVGAAWQGSRRARVLGTAATLLAVAGGLGAFGRRLDARQASGPPTVDAGLLAWARSPGSRGPILAVGLSQAQAFLFGREMLLIPQTFFTGAPWDDAQLDAVVSRYGVRHVVVARDRTPEAYPGAAAALLAGRRPAWLRPVGEGPGAAVFAVERAVPVSAP